jgi:hypothetical protein
MVILLRRLFISMIVPFLWKKWRERSNTQAVPADQQVGNRRGQRGRRFASSGA